MMKKNFTRKDLSNKIYQNLGFSKNYSSTIIDNFFETLIQELIKSHKIKISSFGTFKVINKIERIGRNHKTKEKGLTINGVKKMLNDTESHSLDDSINLSVYKPDLRTTKVIKEKIKNISKIINELKNIKNG